MSDELDPDEVPTVAGPDGPAGGHGDSPEFIGPYRLLKPLGEGGMGQVFAAEQKEPIRRKVALKIIKPGMDTKEVLARFEAERQAVALMDHTNIARVYDAGTTEDGRPYFAMELVEGKPLTEFCDEKKLPLKDRLELFRQVCHAVQHAHQKGIIHRDLKPSNILITTDSGKEDRPVPKIIDFGVAKALGPGLTEQTLFTMAGQIIGTPQYMSPEQAQFDASDIDTRSDIYSLGVLLYELLTGRTPVEMAELKKAGIDEMLRTIREEEAPKPSTRLHSLEDQTQTSVAEVRQLPPSKLTQTLRGDLDWIVMKALEKERSRRYETANAFASDIQRYLTNEPVEASPPSARYRLKKFARRNRGLLTAGGAVVAVLVAGIVTTAWQAREARLEQERAESARADAEKLVTFMLEDLRTKLTDVGKLELMEGVETAVREYYDSTPSERDPREEEQRARSHLMSSETYESQGRIDDAISEVVRASQVWRWLVEQDPQNLGFEESLAESLRREAELLRKQGRVIEASVILNEALGKLRQIPTEQLSIDGLISLSQAERSKAIELVDQRGLDHESEEAAISAVRYGLIGLQRNLETSKVQRAVGAAILNSNLLGVDISALWEEFENPGDYVQIMEASVGSDLSNYEEKAAWLAVIADEFVAKGDRAPVFEKARELAGELTTHDPSNLEWRRLAAAIELRFASNLSSGGFGLEALEAYQRAESEYETLLQSGRANERDFRSYGSLLSMMGLQFVRLKRRDDALIYQQRAVEVLEKSLQENPDSAENLRGLAFAKLRLSGVMAGTEEEKFEVLIAAHRLADMEHGKSPHSALLAHARFYTSQALANRYLELNELELATEYNDMGLKMAEVVSPLFFTPVEFIPLMRRGRIAIAAGDKAAAAAAYRQAAMCWGDGEAIQFIPVGGYPVLAKNLAHAVNAMLNHSQPLTKENHDLGIKYLDKMYLSLQKTDPETHGIPDAIKAVRSVERFYADKALEEKDEATFRLHVHRATKQLIEWLNILPQKSDRLKLLADFGWDLNEWDQAAYRTGWVTAVSVEQAHEIADLCEKEKFFDSHEEKIGVAALNLPWFACQNLVRHASSVGERDEAISRLNEVEEFLTKGFYALPEHVEWRRSLPLTMRQVGMMQNNLDNPAGSERAFRASIAWLDKLSVVDEEQRIRHLVELSHSATELAKRMDEWGKPDEDCLPLMIVRTNSRLSAWDAGDERSFGDLVIALVDLGQVEARLEQVESARERYRKALELASECDEATQSSFSPQIKRHLAEARENLGRLAAANEDWSEAERWYRESLEAWLEPGVSAGASGSLLANRVKIRLSTLYRDSGRGDSPERLQWCEEVVEQLSPLEMEGELPGSLKWVIVTARNQLKAMPSNGE